MNGIRVLTIQSILFILFFVLLVTQGRADWQRHTILGPPFDATCVRTADFDLDGDLDLVVTPMEQQGMFWLENVAGVGTVWDPHPMDSPQFDHPAYLDTGDLNSDGYPDVALGGDDGQVIVYLNTPGNPGFNRVDIYTYVGSTTDIALADIDGDDDLDVVSYGANYINNDYRGVAFWFENLEGTGISWQSHPIHQGTGISSPDRSMAVADLNGDSFPDVILHDYQVSWHSNQAGDGTDWVRTDLDNMGDGTDIAAADIDGDGDIDLCTSDWYYHEVRWWENIFGSGVYFEATTVYDFDGIPDRVNVADIDGNGRLDIVSCAGDEDGEVLVGYTSDPGGSIAVDIIADLKDAPVCAWPADIDGDGDTDIMVTGNSWEDSNAGLIVLAQNGTPTPFAVELVPVSEPVIPPDGGWLHVMINLMNYLAEPQILMNLRLDAIDPVGSELGPFLDQNLTLKPYMTSQTVPFNVYVPDGRLPGSYTLRATLTAPNGLTASDQLVVTVESD